MRNTIFFLTLFSFAITLNSCTKDIDLPIPETTPRLVMNGLIQPDSVLVLNLSSSISAKSGNLPAYVNDGSVKVYENGNLLSTLHYVPAINSNPWSAPIEGNYIDSNLSFLPGHTYTVKAVKSGFADVVAEVSVPIIPKVDTLSVDDVLLSVGGGFGGGSQTTDGKSIKFKIVDPDQNNKNYYLIRVSQFDSSFMGYLDASIGTNNLNLQDLNGLQGSTESANKLYLNDAIFRNGTYEGEIHFAIYTGGWGSFISSIYYLEILSVTKDYYQYLQSVDSYWDTNGNPFAEPSQITTNVTNGYGMIGAQVVKRFRLP
jgi:hypothetical protein